MSLSPKLTSEIPVETFEAARKAYPDGHVYLLVGDRLESILEHVNLQDLDPTLSIGPGTISRLALVTAFQYADRLPDELAAQATLKRVDWKYALHLPVQHPGYSATALCEFRQNLYSSNTAMKELTRLLEQLGALGLGERLTRKPLDPGEFLFFSCSITRLYLLKKSMKAALSLLVSNDPDWLRVNALPHWYTRYQTSQLNRPAESDLTNLIEEISAIEADICHLLNSVSETNLTNLDTQPEFQYLNRIKEKFHLKGETPHWHHPGCINFFCNRAGENT